jgi:hypothetical protein
MSLLPHSQLATTSHQLLQDALNHQGDDGVVFLREQGAQERSWVVLLILNKHWFYEGGGSEQQREHGVCCGRVEGQLPATME